MINKILLPTDGSEHSDHTVQFAIDLAKLTHAAIVAMYAYNPQPILRKRGALAAEELKSSLEEDAREIIGDVATRLKAEGISVSALAVEGPAAEAILRAIEEEKPDLVVMGSRSASSVPGLTLGSVAEKVVRYSPVSVVVVK